MRFTDILNGAYLVEDEKFIDNRGFFTRVYCYEEFKKKINFHENFINANHSKSIKKNTLRGLHYQKKNFAEDKYIRCFSGKAFIQILDIRKNSKTQGQSFSVELSPQNGKSIFVPKGFANSFFFNGK